MTLHTDYMESQQISKVVKDLATGDETTIETYSAIWYTIVILLVLSFYWTNQVVGNVVQTTVAGAVGTWWFVPEDATGCCSLALLDSLQRSLTYSFGSICLGSLLVAILQTLKAIAEQAESANRRENNGGGAILACIAKCLLDCLERIVEYFNKWAFIYVGLYGYDYVHAGKNVFNLFQEKGWTAVISDNLTARVLGMLSFGVGIFTAVLAGIICAFLSVGNGVLIIVSAVAAVLIGTIMASIIFSVVNSGVDTVIVLYAEAPNEFHQSHPQLSVNMNEAWNAAWPDIFGQQQWVPAQSAVV